MSSFPPFGENLYGPEGDPLVIWDLDLNQRVDYVSDGSSSSRPFDSEEILLAESLRLRLASRKAREDARLTIRAIITDIQLERDKAQAVIDDPAASSQDKAVARVTKRMGAAVIDLAQFVKDI